MMMRQKKIQQEINTRNAMRIKLAIDTDKIKKKHLAGNLYLANHASLKAIKKSVGAKEKALNPPDIRDLNPREGEVSQGSIFCTTPFC